MEWKSHLRDYRGLLIAVGIISGAFYIALYGPRSLYVIAGFALAVSLFWVRVRYRMFYGFAECGAGAFALLESYSTGRGAFAGAFSEAFQRYEWHVVFLTTLA